MKMLMLDVYNLINGLPVETVQQQQPQVRRYIQAEEESKDGEHSLKQVFDKDDSEPCNRQNQTK